MLEKRLREDRKTERKKENEGCGRQKDKHNKKYRLKRKEDKKKRKKACSC